MSEALIIPESAKSYAEICLSAISQHKESLAGDTYELLDNLELADEEVILKVLTSVSSMDIYDKIAIKNRRRRCGRARQESYTFGKSRWEG